MRRQRPESFRFCFTLDTEPDDLWAGDGVCRFDHFDALFEFHRRLVDAGARPTYLTTSEVAEAPQGRRALRRCLDAGACEVGAHFHAWTRAWPFPVPDLGSPPRHVLAHRLGQAVEERMLAFTCRALREALGVEARSYRGGKWSLGPDSARSLWNCGIAVDSTLTPGLAWSGASGTRADGIDHRDAPRRPHRLFVDGAPARGEQSARYVIELPVGTAVFPRFARALYRRPAGRRLAAVVRRAGLRAGAYLLRPTERSLGDLVAVMRSLRRAGCPVWVLMIHSSEIVPSTKLPTNAAVDAFLDRCLGAVRAALDLGARSATLAEAAAWATEEGHLA